MGLNEEFNAWLQTELANRNWNQSDLAKRAGISRKTVSKILCGDRSPGIKTCNGIAVAFKISPTFVYAKAGLMPSKSDQSAEITDLIVKFSRLSIIDQKNVVKFIEELQNKQ